MLGNISQEEQETRLAEFAQMKFLRQVLMTIARENPSLIMPDKRHKEEEEKK